MWTINTLNFPAEFQNKIYACDGCPITNHPRNVGDDCCRVMVATIGYFDIQVLPPEKGSTQQQLKVQDRVIPYGDMANLTIDLSDSGKITIATENTQFTVAPTPIPQIPGINHERFQEMVSKKLVPFQHPPSGKPKSVQEIQTLATTHFPGDPCGFDKTMSLYDWTSASFIRQDLFHQLRYTAMPEEPLDLKTMARVIWGCNYPGYTPADANFMNQFGMSPASSEADVYEQLLQVHSKILPLAVAEMNIQVQALLSLPKTTVVQYPQLYRGAMPMSGGYNTSDFSPSLFEYPGNAGPATVPLIQTLEDAISGILKPGSIITTKGPWSFSNDLDGAKVWQNGILITCNPPEGSDFWPGCADITAFSLNPDTFEINVPPATRYRIESLEWITIQEKPVCHFTMTMLGYCGNPMV